MFRFARLIALLLFGLMFFTLPAAAQEEDSCTPVITTAVEQSAELCSGMERNSVCYGNNLLEAIQRSADSTTAFETPGDKIPLTELQSLDLSGYNPETEEWGIAILTLQANLPDTLPGQGVTLILFGDVAVEEDTEVEADTTMQAIRFTSGIGKTECAAAPDGLLVQTPQGVASVQLSVNGMSVELGSTALIHLEETEDGDPLLHFDLLEGSATLQVEDGDPVEIEGGFGVTVQMDEDGNAVGDPSDPEPLAEADTILPLLTLLPDEVTLPEALEAASTDETGNASGDIIPRVGNYQVSVLSHTNNGCSQIMVDNVLRFMVQETTLTEANQQHYIETGELFMGASLEALPDPRFPEETTIEVTIDAEIASEGCSVTLETRAEWTGE